MMEDSYTPVQYEYREQVQELMARKARGKVFFFTAPRTIDDADGIITNFEEVPGKGLFITISNDKQIRIDRIVTLFGKPGAAYDEYEALGNVCLDCTGGYDL